MQWLSKILQKGPKRVDLNRRFELIGRVGQGSMSKVWKARDKETGRLAALKVLDRDKTERFEARFDGRDKPSEGEVAASLDHPHIVRTYQHGLSTDGDWFLAMEYLEGTTLAARIGPQSVDETDLRCRWMLELGRAIEHVHSRGFMHRDISPRNSFVTAEESIKLIDFGLTIPCTKAFCKPGNRTGTANYMAPELIRRQPTDQRVDVFAFAVTCFETATGRRPWESARSLDAMMHHLNSPPTPMSELAPKYGESVANVVMRGLATDRMGRWESMTAMLAALEKAVAEKPGVRSDANSPLAAAKQDS